MLVEHQRVEAHLLGVDFLVEVAVVELRADVRVVRGVARIEVGEVEAGGSEEAGLCVLIGALGEIADQHDSFSVAALA